LWTTTLTRVGADIGVEERVYAAMARLQRSRPNPVRLWLLKGGVRLQADGSQAKGGGSMQRSRGRLRPVGLCAIEHALCVRKDALNAHHAGTGLLVPVLGAARGIRSP
jgi:hypothetical protein